MIQENFLRREENFAVFLVIKNQSYYLKIL